MAKRKARRTRRHAGRGGTRSELKRALNGQRLLDHSLMALEAMAIYTIPMTLVGAKGPIAMLFSAALVMTAGILQRSTSLQFAALALPVLHSMYIWGNAPVKSITGRYIWRFDPNAKIPIDAYGAQLADSVAVHPNTAEQLKIYEPTDLPSEPAPASRQLPMASGSMSDYVSSGSTEPFPQYSQESPLSGIPAQDPFVPNAFGPFGYSPGFN